MIKWRCGNLKILRNLGWIAKCLDYLFDCFVIRSKL